MREIGNLREGEFFAEPLIESKGHKLVPINTMLTIHSHTGAINVPVSRDGAIENFPISNELLAENPLVIANQPKGSLEVSLQIRIPVPSQRRFSYSVLVSAVREANHLFKRDAGLFAIFAPQTKDLTFVFARSQSHHATLTVFWKGAPKTTIGDDEGMLTVRADESSKEDPEVQGSEIPKKILALPRR